MKTSDWQMIYILYQCENITNAAEKLYMTQPNFSKRLQSIENELGVKIVNRSRKGVEFTAEGKYLALKALEILDINKEVLAYLEDLKKTETGTLKIGVPNSFARFSLPKLLQCFRDKYTHISFEIITTFSSNIVKMLQNKEIDVGFINGDIPFDGKKYLYSTDQAYIANLYKIDFWDLPNIPQISYLQDSYTKKMFELWWKDYFSCPPLFGMRANHGDTCREMVLNGLGYGMFFIKEYLENTNIYSIPLFFKNGTPFIRNTWLIYYEEDLYNSLIKKFAEFCMHSKTS